MGYYAELSCNDNLSEGMTDGKYKKVVANRRSVEPGMDWFHNRECLNDIYYGIHETNPKVAPDGTIVSTPDYVATKEAQIGV